MHCTCQKSIEQNGLLLDCFLFVFLPSLHLCQKNGTPFSEPQPPCFFFFDCGSGFASLREGANLSRERAKGDTLDDIPRNFLLLSCFNLLSPRYSSRECTCVQPVECSSLVDCIPAACEKCPVAGGEDVVVAADVLAGTTRLVETVNVLQKDTLKAFLRGGKMCWLGTVVQTQGPVQTAWWSHPTFELRHVHIQPNCHLDSLRTEDGLAHALSRQRSASDSIPIRAMFLVMELVSP